MTSHHAKSRLSDWFRQWRLPLRKFLIGKVGVATADVDDVAQEVFLRLLRYEKGELVEHPQAYLFKMASNVAAEWSIRARQRRPHEPKWLSGIAGSEQPEVDLLRFESQDRVEQALSTLTPRQREIMRLFFYEELNYAQIADRLGDTLRSVRRNFVKSYEKLRHELDPALIGAMRHGRD
jgi:RNA polymerase sigma factor (sigma-70 family)